MKYKSYRFVSPYYVVDQTSSPNSWPLGLSNLIVTNSKRACADLRQLQSCSNK